MMSVRKNLSPYTIKYHSTNLIVVRENNEFSVTAEGEQEVLPDMVSFLNYHLQLASSLRNFMLEKLSNTHPEVTSMS